MALGVGANVAVFSVGRALLLPDLPYADSTELVQIWGADSSLRPQPVLRGDYESTRQHAAAFAALAACSFGYASLRTAGADAADVVVSRVTRDFFSLLGVKPALGRAIEPADFELSQSPIVISDRIWRLGFGGSNAAIGGVLFLNGQPRQVIGVMPAAFQPRCASETGVEEVWMAESDPGVLPSGRSQPSDLVPVTVFGRLRTTATLEDAQGQVALSFGSDLPRSRYRNELGLVAPLGAVESASARSGLLLLQGASAALLVIACVNLMGVLLATAMGRGRELALRLALGATRFMLVRQLIAEAMPIAVSGGLLGALAALEIVPVFVSAAGRLIPPWVSVRVSFPEFSYGLGIGVAVTVASAGVPAVLAGLLPRDLARSGDQIVAPRVVARSRQILLAVQVAISLVSVTVSALLVASLWKVLMPPLGFRASGLVAADIAPPPGVTGRQAYDGFKVSLTNSVRRRLGDRVAFANEMPMSTSSTTEWRLIDPNGGTDPRIYTSTFRAVSWNYFDVLDIPLLGGVAFSSREPTYLSRVAMISSDFNRRYSHGRQLLGFRIKYGDFEPFTIRGIVGDTRGSRYAVEFLDAVYVPLDQVTVTHVSIGIRADTVGTVGQMVRAAVRDVSPDARVVRLVSLDSDVNRPQGQRYFYATVISALAGISLLLTFVGLSSVTLSATRERARELGLRLALGAQRTSVIAMMVRQSARAVVRGLIVGLLSTWLVANELRRNNSFMSQLYQTNPHDPLLLAAGAAMVLALSVTVCWLAARRLAGASPLEALKTRDP